MIQYHVLTSGARMFDACHAYGVGILLSAITAAPVELTWHGVGYQLTTTNTPTLPVTAATISALLTLPDATAVAQTTAFTDPPVPIGNLDGLLAVTFTTRGMRLVSVRNALHNQTMLSEHACAEAVTKAQVLVERIGAYLERLQRRTTGSLSTVLTCYMNNLPSTPTFQTKRKSDLTIPMTIDPMLGFSTRQMLSDGHITKNTNLAVAEPPLAAPLAVLGAARFLRGQHCAARLVNLYVPLPHQITITSTTCLSLLTGTSTPATQALSARWLAHAEPPLGAAWQALAFHTLQTQGGSQSITRTAGVVDYDWLTTLRQRAGSRVIRYWRFALHQSRIALPYELDTLVACLLHRSEVAWQHHLDEIARLLAANPDANVRPYTDLELKEITAMLPTTNNLSLRVVLANEHGTQRFGHALRQLGRYNPSALRECAEELDAVRDLDGLLRILAQMTQTCAVLKAKSEFIIVPTDADLDPLLADVEQFGVRHIASVLLLLAVLRYPKEDKPDRDGQQPDQAKDAQPHTSARSI